MSERKRRDWHITPHHKIAQLMLWGDWVSPDQIKEAFSHDEHMTHLINNRLGVYIYDIRKYENGIIKVQKNGKTVLGYRLENADMFNMNGQWAGVSRKAIAATEFASWFDGDVPGDWDDTETVTLDPVVVASKTPRRPRKASQKVVETVSEYDDPAYDVMLGDDSAPWVDLNAVPLVRNGAVVLRQIA